MEEILQKAGKSALRGGIPGMISMCVQVLGLMWLRTTMNYQYANGTNTMTALKTLYADGGIPRFYKGLAPALIQGPLSRFGDTAANAGMLALLEGSSLPIFVKTFAASGGAACFRVFLMPVDTLKTYMQVNGAQALPMLGAKIKAGGPFVLYAGALASLAATWVGHYPWFVTHNYLNAKLPRSNVLWRKLVRSAFIGWCSSFVSDVVSNNSSAFSHSISDKASAASFRGRASNPVWASSNESRCSASATSAGCICFHSSTLMVGSSLTLSLG